MALFHFIKKSLAHYTWDLAYGEYSESILGNGIKGVKLHIINNPYKKKWFADPFILKDTMSELHILVEEFDSDIKRGRIAHLIIDKHKDIIVDCTIVLDISTHLSFPAIYRIGEQIYVHPENSRSGRSFIYKYDVNNKKMSDPICICNEPIADAIIRDLGSHYEMYATRNPSPNGNTLIRYESRNFLGPYVYVDQKIFNSNIARMAGYFIESTKGLVRPSQDCNNAYGKAVFFMMEDEIISELRPTSFKYAGIHTFNTLANTFVIDLKKYDYPLFYHLKNIFK